MTDLIANPLIPPQAGTAANPSDPSGDPAALRHAAQEFEAIFLAQVLSTMNRGLAADGQEGGAGGEAGAFHDMLNQELAKVISRTGGVGVADAVLNEMLKLQEVA